MNHITARHSGIDLLKICAICMVVMLHCLGHGGALDSCELFSKNYDIAWFLECCSTCAVNCFALCTGYLCLKARNSYSKLMQLWLQLFFYSVGIMLLFNALGYATLEGDDVTMRYFPVTCENWWYASSYFGMFFLIPILNIAVEKMPKRLFLKTLIIFYVFSAFASLFPIESNPFSLDNGYSSLWLCAVYLLGAYFQKYDCFKNASKLKSLLVFFVCALLMTFLKAWNDYSAFMQPDQFEPIFVNSYLSPFTIGETIALFAFFRTIDVKDGLLKKIIKTLSTTAFGVYLISDDRLVRAQYITDAFKWAGESNFITLMPKMFIGVVVIFVIGSLIDFLRLKLFQLLRINKLCDMLNGFLSKQFDKVLTFLTR